MGKNIMKNGKINEEAKTKESSLIKTVFKLNTFPEGRAISLFGCPVGA